MMKKIFIATAVIILAVIFMQATAPKAHAAAVSWDRPAAGRINPINKLDQVFVNMLTGTSTTATSSTPIFQATSRFLGAGLSSCSGSGNALTYNSSTWNFGCATLQPSGNYITALTGDVTASGPGSVNTTLATVNGNVGTFTNATLTVNGKGLITAASSGTAPVTSVSGTANQINSTGGATPVLSLANHVIFPSSFQAAMGSTTNATSTNMTVTGNLITSVLSKILKTDGNGLVTGATSGTDYAPATSGTSILKGNGSGGFSNAANGTDYTLVSAVTCSNQALTALTAAGGSTCSSITDSFISGQISVAHGGTGAATLTGLLQGNGTSAITAITGTAGQFPFYSGTNTIAATSTLFLATTGNVGVGTTSPYAKFSVGGDTVIGAPTAGGTFGSLFLPALGTAAGTFLAADANGKVIATTTPSSSGSAYPFPLSGNATSTLTQFQGGITATASSTIGGGTAKSGLTINGNATTTGNMLVDSGATGTTTLQVGDTSGANGHPACITMRDTADGGTSYVYVKNGVLFVTTSSCQ